MWIKSSLYAYIFRFTILFFSFFQEAAYSKDTLDFELPSKSKPGINDTIVVRTIIYNNEKYIYSELDPIEIYVKLSEQQKKRRKKWYKLKRTVFLTYPYMKAIKTIMNDIDVNTSKIKGERERNEYLKKKEAELKEQFTNRLLNMTMYEGKILIKLVHRETGKTCFDIIKQYKGASTAIAWQALAIVFGSSLAKKYDPKGEDMEIESIISEAQRVYGF